MTEKIEQFWRDATAEDIAKVMKGENVYARFRDRYADGWAEYYLSGVNGKNWIAGNFRWDLCQVYDPPQWYTDKPDPGEGYRLLEKFPDEPKLGTDEAWDCHSKEWRRTFANDGDQAKAVWYRRRIEAVKQDAQADGDFRKFVDKVQAGKLSFTCTFLWDGNELIRVKVGDRIQHPNGCCIDITETGFKVNATLDTVEFGE